MSDCLWCSPAELSPAPAAMQCVPLTTETWHHAMKELVGLQRCSTCYVVCCFLPFSGRVACCSLPFSGHLGVAPTCVVQQRRGMATGLASSVSSSKTATLTRSWKATQTRTARKTKHTRLDNWPLGAWRGARDPFVVKTTLQRRRLIRNKRLSIPDILTTDTHTRSWPLGVWRGATEPFVVKNAL